MRSLLLLLLLCLLVTTALSRGRGFKRGHSKGRGPRGRGLIGRFFRDRGYKGWGFGWRGRDYEWNRGQKRACRPRNGDIPLEAPLAGVEPVSQERTLVGTCTADIGACPVGSCTYNERLPEKCRPDGYICPETQIREIDCGLFGSFNVSHVIACRCCKDEGIAVTGLVFDSVSRTPLAKTSLRLGKKQRTVTANDGTFEVAVDSRSQRVVIRASRKNYISTVRIVDIPDGFRGPLEVLVGMVKVADPVEIDANVENELPITVVSNNTAENETRASILIPAGSFRRRGRTYRGKVLASVTFIDTADPALEAEIPGRFVTVTGEPLITDGIFAINSQTPTGQTLSLGLVTVNVRDGMRLWTLTDDGEWAPAQTRRGRRKRQAALTNGFLVRIENGRWINIDKIPGAPQCYFKTRVFDQTTNTEITSSATASFRPSAIAYTRQNQRLPFYLASTSEPANICHVVRCPDISNPASLLVGLINMESFETVSVGGNSLPVISTLTPRNLADYLNISPVLFSSLSAVHYEVTPSGDQLFINYISDANGPFYTSITDCQNSTATEPSFHFLKPALPSYIPPPDDVELCTARIGFFNNYYFIDALNASDTLPLVTITSTWTVNDTSYYFTDSAVMELSSSGEDFAYLCARYRCSDEEANTTIFLNINTPNITVNVTGQDVYETPAFNCWGNCTTGTCFDKERTGISFDGSFIAPANITEEIGFFANETNTCNEGSAYDPFAAKYYCYGNREMLFESSGGQPA